MTPPFFVLEILAPQATPRLRGARPNRI